MSSQMSLKHYYFIEGQDRQANKPWDEGRPDV